MLRDKRKETKQEIEAMPASGDILFADYMEFQWLEYMRQEIARKKLKLTTFGGYQMNVLSTIAPWFRERGILLRTLTAEDINEFYDDCLERVKANSVLKFHANISKGLKVAVKKKLIPYSVMGEVERPSPEKYVGKFLRQSEAVALFEAVKGHKLELGVILGAFYGLRRGEVVGLRWDAIDFETNTITIRHTVTTANVDGKHMLVVDDTTKTKSSFRTLPLVPTFREKLLAVKDEQEYYRKLCGKSYSKAYSGYIYTDQLGERIKPQYLTEAFPKFMERNGFQRLRFHDLRHSCASLLLAAGVPLKQIQEWLGHSDFAITTNTYAHLEFNSKVASANAMTWIDKTSLAEGVAAARLPAGTSGKTDLQTRLSDALNGLIASGAPLELISLWLKQDGLAEADDLQAHYAAFTASQIAFEQRNSQPITT